LKSFFAWFKNRVGNRMAIDRSNNRHLLMESLEDRSLMASLAGGVDYLAPLAATHTSAVHAKTAPATSNLRALLTDDAYEQNDTLSTAYNLGTLSSSKTISNLVMADSADWYKFTVVNKPGANDTVSINLQDWQGDLDLGLYNAYGTRLRFSGTANNTETVSLSGLSAGTYYIRVYGYLGATNPSYSLSVNLAAPLVDDSYENNDTISTAKDLGALSALTSISNLVMADGNDWYKFSMGAAGTSTDFVSVNSTSAQGDLDLELYNASGTRLAASTSPTDSEQVSLSGRAAGTYYVHVIGYNNATTPNYTLQIDPGTASSGGTTGGTTSGGTTSGGTTTTGSFDIQFRFSGLTSAEQTVFDQAAAKWESVIVGDLPSATYGGVAVDDLLIDASGAAIDGTGNILGQAGPDAFRSSGLPYHGTMEFDSADLASMLSNGTLLSVIEHEMGHVLGIGTVWSDKGLLVGAGTTNPIFVGTQATAAYNSIFGTNVSGVPVENTGGSGTQDAHWRESILGSELMTGWVGPGTYLPLSRITIGSLADIGYSVNYAVADNFTPAIAASGSLLASSLTTSTSSTATARVQSTVLTPPLASESVHDAVLTHLASHDHQHDDDDSSTVTTNSRHVHERATDSLFANWKPLGASLTGRGRWG
jgi:hypothetical protein